jgi:hypothetical protein
MDCYQVAVRLVGDLVWLLRLDSQAQLVSRQLLPQEIRALQLDLQRYLLAHQLVRQHLLALVQLELLLFWLALSLQVQVFLLLLPLTQETCRVNDE